MYTYIHIYTYTHIHIHLHVHIQTLAHFIKTTTAPFAVGGQYQARHCSKNSASTKSSSSVHRLSYYLCSSVTLL